MRNRYQHQPSIMNIAEAIKVLEMEVHDPKIGLPDEVFYYISKTTPLVNVDLLIKDEDGHTLLAWRNDPFVGIGWHIPGGIIRFKETFDQRIQKVAQLEIGVHKIEYDQVPLEINQIIVSEREIRGHFISILYECFLSNKFVPKNEGLSPANQGYLMWHDSCPIDLLKFHEIYRKYLTKS